MTLPDDRLDEARRLATARDVGGTDIVALLADLVAEIDRLNASSFAFDCDRCHRPLDKPGAIVFGPPLNTDVLTVAKFHVCVDCWPILAHWIVYCLALVPPGHVLIEREGLTAIVPVDDGRIETTIREYAQAQIEGIGRSSATPSTDGALAAFRNVIARLDKAATEAAADMASRAPIDLTGKTGGRIVQGPTGEWHHEPGPIVDTVRVRGGQTTPPFPEERIGGPDDLAHDVTEVGKTPGEIMRDVATASWLGQ